MPTITVKGGTPLHGESICKTCQWVHMIRGYRESQEVIICTYIDPNREVTFAVCECSHFRSSITPSPQQMEDIALIIPTQPARKSAGFAGIGFGTSAEEVFDQGVALVKESLQKS
jgi:hypothetical protein